jgi:hypothetical protein
MSDAARAINHNHGIALTVDKACVVHTPHELVRAGYGYTGKGLVKVGGWSTDASPPRIGYCRIRRKVFWMGEGSNQATRAVPRSMQQPVGERGRPASRTSPMIGLYRGTRALHDSPGTKNGASASPADSADC